MKAVKFVNGIVLVITIGLIFSNSILAQDETVEKPSKERERIAKVDKTSDTVEVKTDDKNASTLDTEDEKEAKKTGEYYDNYLKEYRLGPNDVISVTVFQQCPDYCISNETIPPDATISYPLIRDGVFVHNKTVKEVAADIEKELSEYIINPSVRVTLVKAGSARYAVMGKVNAPGVSIMDRRISINEAILNAGGIAKDGNKKKVYIARINSQGFYSQEPIDYTAIETGKAPTIFLQPGDQVIVGGKGFTWEKFFKVLGNVSAARVLFGGGIGL